MTSERKRGHGDDSCAAAVLSARWRCRSASNPRGNTRNRRQLILIIPVTPFSTSCSPSCSPTTSHLPSPPAGQYANGKTCPCPRQVNFKLRLIIDCHFGFEWPRQSQGNKNITCVNNSDFYVFRWPVRMHRWHSALRRLNRSITAV